MTDKMAGIDVHKKVLMVVVMDARTPESKPERRRFATMPSELRRLSTWLQERGVEEAVMESTAQYWRSVWLEAAHAAARSKGTHFQAVSIECPIAMSIRTGESVIVTIDGKPIW